MERERWGNDPDLARAVEQGYAENGFAGATNRIADILASRYGKPGSVTGYTLANYYARARDKERVIEWLGKAYQEHNNNLPYMRTPVFDLAREDPRYQALLGNTAHKKFRIPEVSPYQRRPQYLLNPCFELC